MIPLNNDSSSPSSSLRSKAMSIFQKFQRREADLLTLLLGFILLAGATLRFWGLTVSAPGIWVDEAFFASTALEILNGNFNFIAMQGDLLHFSLYPLMLLPGFWLLGDNLYALRAVLAFWSTLALIGCYGCTRELFYRHPQARHIALTATALLAASYWQLSGSRMAWSSSIVPLFATFSIWLTLRAMRLGSTTAAALAATVTSLGFYTYWSYYPFVFMPAIIALMSFIRQPRGNKAFCVYVAVGFTVFIPVIYTYLTHDMLTRVRSIGLFPSPDKPPLERYTGFGKQLVSHIWLHIRMLYIGGDGNLRHNLPGYPQLALLPRFGVIAALVYLLRLQIFNRAHPAKNPLFIALLWAFFAMLPAVLSWEGLPHSLRSQGMVVPLQIIAATGLVGFVQGLHKHLRIYAYGAMVSVITFQFATTAYLYFRVLPYYPRVHREFMLGNPDSPTFQYHMRFNYAREGEILRLDTHQKLKARRKMKQSD